MSAASERANECCERANERCERANEKSEQTNERYVQMSVGSSAELALASGAERASGVERLVRANE